MVQGQKIETAVFCLDYEWVVCCSVTMDIFNYTKNQERNAPHIARLEKLCALITTAQGSLTS